jgi:hypothetical protein
MNPSQPQTNTNNPVNHAHVTGKPKKDFAMPTWGRAAFLPIIFLKFWYFDIPWEMLAYFFSLNNYMMKLLALPLSIKTYFKPLKNEYREGLVGFSRAMGMIIKTGIITAGLFIFSIMITIETIIFLSFLLFPVATIALLFM